MTALVSIFSLIKVYLDYYACVLFGGNFTNKPYTGEFHKIAYDLISQTVISLGGTIIPYNPNGYVNFDLPGVPLFQICLGIFVFGAIIGLVKRLLRG